jgi:type IV secretion system protein VirD4
VDPFHVVTTKPDCFNPVDFVYKDDPYAIDHCNDLGKSLVARQSDERDPHWNDSAEAWISSAIATVVYYGDRKESRSLQTVREILSHPQKLDMALKLMRESDCWGGMLARMGGQLSHFVDKERSSTLTTVSRHLRFLDTPTIAESTKTSSFDPAELRSGKMTIYLILPPEHLRANAGLLRMWISSLLRGVVRGGLEA